METRKESDSLGALEIPLDKYYGSQTARSLKFFSWGDDVMPVRVIRALGIIKKCAASANHDLGFMQTNIKDLIHRVADEVIAGSLDDHFPLRVWQTGSGTQSNMNMNEVISNRAIELCSGVLGSKDPVHPNDHVNMSQSSNDVFPTAMHIAAVLEIKDGFFESLDLLRNAIYTKAKEFSGVIKIGRTHLMDAVPITFGQEFSGYIDQLDKSKQWISSAFNNLHELAVGATAVGTGINVPDGFINKIIEYINLETGLNFTKASNYFSALSCHDAVVNMHGTLKTLACSLLKIVTDLSLMGSGPRCGLGELLFPENEPGSSIMPGKINPTQCEALSMVCVQVLGNDAAVAIAGSRGNFELNVMKPLMIYNLLHSIRLLKGGMKSFADNFVSGLIVNKDKIDFYLERSLMLVTALSPKIGYDKSSKIALKAFHENKTLKQACLELGFMTEDEFNQAAVPGKMIGNNNVSFD